MAEHDIDKVAVAPKRRRSKGTSLTLRDVARLANVAPITASRALNTPEAVSDEILLRVREAVERTGYVPNLLAGGLASRRTRLVAAVVPTITGSVFLETVQALTDTLAASGYQMMLGQAGYAGSREDALLEAIIARRPDGVILTGIMHSTLARRRLVASGIPVVETWDLTPNPVDMLVGFSHEQLGAAVAHFLQRRGRRHVASITADDERAVRRHAAFGAAAASLGIAGSGALAQHVVPAPSTAASGREGLRVLLDRAPGIDAIFCSSDMVALGVLVEAQALGIAVPSQLAIVGMGDLALSRDLQPPLTTVRVDGTLIGDTAARYIMQRADGRAVEQPIRDVGFTIVERGTT
ncbi:LacI family DNA-binding transcriptional regulator [Pseudoduganella plicata]|uniref:LacI family DNA-binding transcriptional regulator n=1 Tax=Pseudoduganella plicata TaxID=321984 RepID=A0A4P7BFW3_9BURK|nr:LacI family DNA-binding transcriptional regulator [Pseudoduganella plicata]QBQ37140.1 LacI family DNA-binding transcriptional regulator [Pseudoduganella plicata]GGY99026.1 LacI family transcriptional regulator [Pseudoduganella plicata]